MLTNQGNITNSISYKLRNDWLCGSWNQTTSLARYRTASSTESLNATQRRHRSALQGLADCLGPLTNNTAT